MRRPAWQDVGIEKDGFGGTASPERIEDAGKNNPPRAVIEVRVARQERRPRQVRYGIGRILVMKAAGIAASMKVNAGHLL